MPMGTIIRRGAARGIAALLVAAGAVLASPAEAQQGSVAIMPTQYFSADAQSAENVTQGLVQRFEAQGYRVMPLGQSRSAFQAMGLSHNLHYPDLIAIQFGRRLGADLVVYPRLLVLGVPVVMPPIVTPPIVTHPWWDPAAVLHLRVLNVRTGVPLYFRQIAYRFTPASLAAAVPPLPQPVALAAAEAVTDHYFARVAGSREEIGLRP